MKRFLVYLKDGRTIEVRADSYHLDAAQYVFVGTEHPDVSFVRVEDVLSIVTAPELRSVNLDRDSEPPSGSREHRF
jgi:hypothetical protein